MCAITTFKGEYNDLRENKETGEIIESFAIITDSPPKFIEDSGHDRCPVFLKSDFYSRWLDTSSTNAEKSLELLNVGRRAIDFKVEIDRPLKAGWDK
jgi:putative SOS response-associated peptidase YedK